LRDEGLEQILLNRGSRGGWARPQAPAFEPKNVGTLVSRGAAW